MEMLGYQGEDSNHSHFRIDDSEDSCGKDEYEQSTRIGFQSISLSHKLYGSLIH